MIDYDQIVQEMSGLPEHRTPREWLVPALEERNRRLRLLASDTEHARAWFVVSAPDPFERALWARMLGAKVQLLATPARTCIARINADPSRAGQAARMVAAVRAWWKANDFQGTSE